MVLVGAQLDLAERDRAAAGVPASGMLAYSGARVMAQGVFGLDATTLSTASSKLLL